ncbi:MAG: radical SAM protein [Proteobacteria bacterium]|nr:radical SAM protein [Pseudomonadota bacterium]
MPPYNNKTKKPLLNETGAVKKDWRGRISVALVYPNSYYVGMSNLGFQAVYRMLNELDHVVCERAFLPDDPYGHDKEIYSLESNRTIRDFDIIAFSISFENDYINVLSILKKTGLPLLSNARGNSHPLIIAGGVTCFLNPEPIAPSIDCIFVGEAETILPRFFEQFDPRERRADMLKNMANAINGLYIPEFYHTNYNKDGTIKSFEPLTDVPGTIQRVYAKDLSAFSTCSQILSKDTSFNGTYLIETGRGCPHGCRFCSAGYIYRPPRFRSLETLQHTFKDGARLSQKIGLVGAAVSDLPCISDLCSLGEKNDITISFSSLRAEALTHDLVSALGKSRMKTATIAPDAGSEKMRNIINKGITEEDILHATQILVEAGIPNLKLYFMVGLPEETDEDVLAISELVKKIKARFLESSRVKKHIGTIHVSVNPFVPKPVTPFQWSQMEGVGSLKHKIKMIQNELKAVSNVNVTADSPKKTLVQGILSRGDRTVSTLLQEVLKDGGNWTKSKKKSCPYETFFALRERDRDEIFPWDFIDHHIQKQYLYQEYKKALQAKKTSPCDTDRCVKCGVCLKDEKNG